MKLKVTTSFLLVTLVFSGAFAGDVAVTDGDGLTLQGERIRLWGLMHPNSTKRASAMEPHTRAAINPVTHCARSSSAVT